MKPKKEFGQNFLEDKSILDKIIEFSNIDSTETILEIGPGKGALTEKILEKCKTLICVELDRELENILIKKFGNNPKFNLIMKDILKVDFEIDIKKNVKTVANIPYYITSPIINKLIENRKYTKEIFLTVQKEVAERIVATPKNSNYGILSIAVQIFADTKILFFIPKESFYPMPKVDSAFLKISIRDNNIYEPYISESFFNFIKKCFANKRKTISNNLVNMGFSKDFINKSLEEYGFSPLMRAEEFSIENFIKIFNLFGGAKL